MWFLSHFQRAELLLRGSHPHKWNVIGKAKMSSAQISVWFVSWLLKCINGCQEAGGHKKVEWDKPSVNGQNFLLFFILFLKAVWKKIGTKERKRVISNKASRDNMITWCPSWTSWTFRAPGLPFVLILCFNFTFWCRRYLTLCIYINGMLLSAAALHNVIALLNATLNSWICLF